MKIILALIIIFPIILFSDEDTESLVESTILLNFKFTQEENVEGVMKTIHSKSLSYISTKNLLPQIFDKYNLSYEITSNTFIGLHDELAFSRVKFLTRKISGSSFSKQSYRHDNGL